MPTGHPAHLGRLVLVLMVAVLQFAGVVRAATDDGQAAVLRGDFNAAVRAWRSELERTSDAAARAGVLMQLAHAYQSLGQMDLAVATLNDAASAAKQAGDAATAGRAYAALAGVLTSTRQFTLAAACLDEAQQWAGKSDDVQLPTLIEAQRGVYHAQAGQIDEASAIFERIASDESTPAPLRASAAVNAVRAAAMLGRGDEAMQWTTNARRLVDALADSHDKAAALLSLGTIELAGTTSDRHAMLTQSATIAQQLGDDAVLAPALLELGRLYETQGQRDEALRLTRRSAFVAQQTGMPDLIYPAQWQTGRLLARQGQVDDAVAAYERAVDTVQRIRPDLSIRYSPVPTWGELDATPAPTFRRVIGPLYFELADLCFRHADAHADDPAQVEKDLLAARDTIEKFRTAELEDYFQERCVEVVEGGLRDIGRVGDRTAVVYYVALADRLEILVTGRGQLQRFTAPMGASELDALTDQFRRAAELRGSYRYIPLARRLYDVLVRPIESVISGDAVDTLVFVPDGVLRTAPMAALHDGEQFLIERYAVAVSPGLALMQPRPIERQNLRMLLSGVSESREVATQGGQAERFSALPYVPGELQRIQTVFGGRTLLNDQFTSPRVQSEVAEAPYGVVHIATHGEFRSDANDSFLLAYDGKMTLDRLEEIIRPAQFRGEPVELLTLSACKTAAGDDRAALGLAGVAIKAGARSALATLWYVNDEASSLLVTDFYEQLKANPTQSKAKALQQAQINMLRDPRRRHACYWSAFLIIGNWL